MAYFLVWPAVDVVIDAIADTLIQYAAAQVLDLLMGTGDSDGTDLGSVAVALSALRDNLAGIVGALQEVPGAIGDTPAAIWAYQSGDTGPVADAALRMLLASARNRKKFSGYVSADGLWLAVGAIGQADGVSDGSWVGVPPMLRFGELVPPVGMPPSQPVELWWDASLSMADQIAAWNPGVSVAADANGSVWAVDSVNAGVSWLCLMPDALFDWLGHAFFFAAGETDVSKLQSTWHDLAFVLASVPVQFGG